jgi:hypothetical protein
MSSVHLSAKQAHVARVLFSIGVTAFVGEGSFLVLRYLIGLMGK